MFAIDRLRLACLMKKEEEEKWRYERRQVHQSAADMGEFDVPYNFDATPISWNLHGRECETYLQEWKLLERNSVCDLSMLTLCRIM